PWHGPIDPEGGSAARREREGSRDGLRALEDPSVGKDELHRPPERLLRNLRIARSRELGGLVVDAVAGPLPPPVDPEAAEAAVAVEEHQWFQRRIRAADSGH